MIGAALLWGVLAVGAADPLVQDQIDLDARRILADDAYGFCHDDQYPLTPAEALWCPYVDEAVGRCPSFAKACEAPQASLRGMGRFSTRVVEEEESKKGQRRGKGGGPGRSAESSKPPEPEEPATMPSLGGLAEILFWGMLAVAVFALFIAIVRNLGPSRRDEEEQALPPTGDEEAQSAVAAARAAMETDVERLLALAERAAARADYAAAVDFAHAALLRRLDHDGLIRLHHSRTNGDYIRDLRAHPELRDPVRDALRKIDRAQFGTVAPDGGAFAEIVQRVRTLVRAGAGGVVALMLFLSLWACTDGGSSERKSYPWSTSPSGSDAVVTLLQRQGHSVEYESGTLTDPPEGHGTTLVVLQDAEISDDEWDALGPWVFDEGGTLVVASGVVPPFVDGIAVEHELLDEEPSPLVVGETFRSQYPVPLVFAPQGRLLSVTPTMPVLLERDGKPYAVRREYGAGRVIVLADDDIFTNASIAMGDNAVFVTALLSETGTKTVLVDAWTSAGADNPLESIRRSHMTPVMLQLLALLGLLYLWRGIPFGRGRDPAPPSRRSFTQHARAMALQYAKGRARGHAASAYAGWALERLRDRYPTAARGGLHALAQTLARKSGRDETDVMRLLVEAHGAAEGGAEAAEAGDLGLVRELGRLMRETGGTT